MEQKRRRQSPSSKPNWNDALALGAIVGACGAIAGAIAAGTRARPIQRVVIGGVDLTETDLSAPFWVDFSPGATRSPAATAEALQRLRFATEEFGRAYPYWACEPDVDLRAGRIILRVAPFNNPALFTARSLLGT